MKNARHNKKISCFKTCFFIGSYAAGMDNSDAPYYFPLEWIIFIIFAAAVFVEIA